MTVVSIRCSKCDTVKRKKHIQLTSDGAVCDECTTPDKVKEVQEAEPEGEEEAESEEPDGDDTTDPTGEEATEEQSEESEGDLSPDDFTENDALSW